MNSTAPPLRRSGFASRRLVGALAVILLLLMAVFIPRWGGLRQKAVVEAARTFRLTSIEPGGHQWSLRDGWPAEGQALVREQVLQFERSDLVEMELNPELSPGDQIEQGQVLAWVRSPRDLRRMAELEAMRAELEAQRALLGAGGRSEEVEEARRGLAVARAAWKGNQTQLERSQKLAAEGAISEAELEAAEVSHRLLELETELASAALAVARSSARPEALAAVEAQITALDARIGELTDRVTGKTIRSPIAGMLEMGGRRVVLRVYDLDPVYLRIAIHEAHRHELQVGSPVRFHTPSVPGSTYEGEVVDVSEDASNLNGLQVFWVSARVENPELQLRSGMTGVAWLELESGRGLLSYLWDVLTGNGS